MSRRIKIKNARLSFPSIFNRASFNGNEGKYEATFLIPKEDEATYNAIMEGTSELIKEHKVKVPKDKLCIKDGDEIEYDGYAGMWAVKASNNSRPTVIDRDKTPLVEEDNKLYAGCYVNAIIELWLQNNQYGKRVNANLLGVQFVKDGEPFGTEKVASPDEFDEVEDDFDDEDEPF